MNVRRFRVSPDEVFKVLLRGGFPACPRVDYSASHLQHQIAFVGRQFSGQQRLAQACNARNFHHRRIIAASLRRFDEYFECGLELPGPG